MVILPSMSSYLTIARYYYRCFSKSKKNAERDGDNYVRNRLNNEEEKAEKRITDRDNK